MYDALLREHIARQRLLGADLLLRLERSIAAALNAARDAIACSKDLKGMEQGPAHSCLNPETVISIASRLASVLETLSAVTGSASGGGSNSGIGKSSLDQLSGDSSKSITMRTGLALTIQAEAMLDLPGRVNEAAQLAARALENWPCPDAFGVSFECALRSGSQGGAYTKAKSTIEVRRGL